jgi:hypothetical protein
VDGGQLRLYPLSPLCKPSLVDVHPLYGRAVLFSSNSLPHRVMSTRSDCRYCISFFFYGESVVPRQDVSFSDIASIMSPAPEENVIRDMLQLKYKDGTCSIENTEENLKSYILKIKQNYPEVLCALIHTKEYYMSLAQAFTDVEFIGDYDDFDGVIDQIRDDVVRKAMIFFKDKCDNLAESVDTDFLDFIKVAKEYIRSEAYEHITI